LKSISTEKLLIALTKSQERRFIEMADNVVYVGTKPPMSYVLAVITLFNEENEIVILKARGRAISTAVDVCELTRNRFLSDLKVKSIEIGTEELPRREGGKINTSTIEITLSK
jgi:DNA-binding protein